MKTKLSQRYPKYTKVVENNLNKHQETPVSIKNVNTLKNPQIGSSVNNLLAEDNLLDEVNAIAARKVSDYLQPQIIERINQPSTKGLYVFEVIDTIATLHFFQYKPDDEAAEQTRIFEQTFTTHKIALSCLLDWYRREKDNGFPGYDLKCKPFRVRDAKA